MSASSPTPRMPAAIYVWLVPSEEMLDQPGSWRIRKWDIEPFPEANFTLAASSERKPLSCDAVSLDFLKSRIKTMIYEARGMYPGCVVAIDAIISRMAFEFERLETNPLTGKDAALLPGLREALKWKPNTPQLENAMTYAWESALKSFIRAIEEARK